MSLSSANNIAIEQVRQKNLITDFLDKKGFPYGKGRNH
jgi:hypothetical protein